MNVQGKIKSKKKSDVLKRFRCFYCHVFVFCCCVDERPHSLIYPDAKAETFTEDRTVSYLPSQTRQTNQIIPDSRRPSDASQLLPGDPGGVRGPDGEQNPSDAFWVQSQPWRDLDSFRPIISADRGAAQCLRTPRASSRDGTTGLGRTDICVRFPADTTGDVT